MALSLAGCGGGRSSSLFSTDIRSNLAADGFVTRPSPPGVDNVSLAFDHGAVQAGIDPATLSESRAFLDFPLDGAGGVPPGARIVTAFLHMFVSRVDAVTLDSFPLVLEIVPPFAPLDTTDFDAAPIPNVAVTQPISPTVHNPNFVDIDVAPLLEAALGLDLRRLQLRVRPGPSPSGSGLVRIEELAIFDTAPRLQVEYFRN